MKMNNGLSETTSWFASVNQMRRGTPFYPTDAVMMDVMDTTDVFYSR